MIFSKIHNTLMATSSVHLNPTPCSMPYRFTAQWPVYLLSFQTLPYSMQTFSQALSASPASFMAVSIGYAVLPWTCQCSPLIDMQICFYNNCTYTFIRSSFHWGGQDKLGMLHFSMWLHRCQQAWDYYHDYDFIVKSMRLNNWSIHDYNITEHARTLTHTLCTVFFRTFGEGGEDFSP